MGRQAVERRFRFGENWRSFLEEVGSDRIAVAENSLRQMLGVDDLAGCSFLDIGCGSGLFSLAAVRLGAVSVRSIDYDRESVAVTSVLKERHAPTAAWIVESGDATDPRFMSSLGTYDVVYAWGVLHHTGAMWRALEHTCARVATDGLLFVAIYNDQGRRSRRWRRVKKLYNRLPRALRAPYAVAVMLPWEARALAGATLRGDPLAYFRAWTGSIERGMSRWHDLLDWVGGYPFEVARPEEVFRFCRGRGFDLIELKTAGGGLGCNQFVFRRDAA